MPAEESTLKDAPAPVLPAAPASKPGWRGVGFAKKILILSVLVHLLFGVGAAVWIVQTSQDKARPAFRSASSSPSASNHALEHKVQMKRKAMSAPIAAKRATTTGLAKITLPPMPPMVSQTTSFSPTALTSGMGGVGIGSSLGSGGASTGFGKPGGTMFMASIGGLNVQARQLAVALDISGSVAQYQDGMQKYVTKTFAQSEVGTFSSAAFSNSTNRKGSIGTVLLGFLNSPKKFDSIYVFSDFGEINRVEQDALPEIQRLVREKKVRLYLHVLRAPGREGNITPALQTVINFARSTGGNVKIGDMPRM